MVFADFCAMSLSNIDLFCFLKMSDQCKQWCLSQACHCTPSFTCLACTSFHQRCATKCSSRNISMSKRALGQHAAERQPLHPGVVPHCLVFVPFQKNRRENKHRSCQCFSWGCQLRATNSGSPGSAGNHGWLLHRSLVWIKIWNCV